MVCLWAFDVIVIVGGGGEGGGEEGGGMEKRVYESKGGNVKGSLRRGRRTIALRQKRQKILFRGWDGVGV